MYSEPEKGYEVRNERKPTAPYDAAPIIAEARSSPRKIAGSADFIRRAKSAPTSAPVPGSGMPTKRTRPQQAYFRTRLLFFSAFFSIHKAIFAKCFVVFIHARIFLMNSRMKGMGSMFPMIERGMT